MASTNETGHHKNVANFSTLISKCNGYGASYNPSNAALSIASLNTLHTNAIGVINKVNQSLPAYNNALSARTAVFKPLNKIITRILNSLKSMSPTAKTTENVITITRKLKGQRASAKLTEDELKTLKEAGKEVTQISTSQLSFDSKIDNLSKLINQLAAIKEYKPNEKELQVEFLTAILEDLKIKNQAAIDSEIPLSNTRIARNEILYKAEVGLVDIASHVKNYVKSLFGATSPQYRLISSLEFKRFKI
jgi:hypothetical protein